MDVARSDVVRSCAGRDSGQLFFVVELDESYVYLADGKGRRVEKPKRKKPQRQREDGKGDDGVGAKFPLAKTCMDLFSIRSGRRAFHTGRSQSGSAGGLYGSENAGMSSANYVRIIMAESLRFLKEGSSASR